MFTHQYTPRPYLCKEERTWVQNQSYLVETAVLYLREFPAVVSGHRLYADTPRIVQHEGTLHHIHIEQYVGCLILPGQREEWWSCSLVLRPPPRFYLAAVEKNLGGSLRTRLAVLSLETCSQVVNQPVTIRKYRSPSSSERDALFHKWKGGHKT